MEHFIAIQYKGHHGRAARQRSAKPSTAVRIRLMPLKPSVKTGGFFCLKIPYGTYFTGLNWASILSMFFVTPEGSTP